MKTINYHMLEVKNACSGHLQLFRETFGDGEVALNSENLKTALNAELDVSFLEKFLSEPQRTEYQKIEGQAWAEYGKVTSQTWAEYEKVTSQAWAEYEKVRDQAWTEYRKVVGQTWTECRKVEGQEWAKYEKVRGMALIRILTEA